MRLKDEDLKEKNRWMDLSIDLGKPIKHEGSDSNIEVSNRFGLTKKKVAINITFSIVKNLVALLALIVVLM